MLGAAEDETRKGIVFVGSENNRVRLYLHLESNAEMVFKAISPCLCDSEGHPLGNHRSMSLGKIPDTGTDLGLTSAVELLCHTLSSGLWQLIALSLVHFPQNESWTG